VSDVPAPVRALDVWGDVFRIAHEAIFGLHRRLVAYERDSERSRDLLAESVENTLTRAQAILAESRRLAVRWSEEELLDPARAAETLDALAVEVSRIEPELRRLVARQSEIARELGTLSLD
jgi:hypothetical protein